LDTCSGGTLDRFSAKWRFQPRPPAPWNKWIRKVYVKPLEVNVHRTLPDHELESLDQEFRPVGIDFQSGESFEFNIVRHFDRLDQPFDVFEGVTIPADRYWWTSYEVQCDSAEKRFWQLSSAAGWGGYYSGGLQSLDLSANLSFGKRVRLSVGYAANRVDLDGGRFATHEFAGRVLYAFSNRANLQTFAQWNNETHVLNVYLRLQITPKVGSDIFGVASKLFDTRRGRDMGSTIRRKFVYPFFL
jgi:hypothetical protein